MDVILLLFFYIKYVTVQGSSLSRGISVHGVSVQGVSVQVRGSLSRRMGGSLSRESLSIGVSVQGVSVQVRGSLSRRMGGLSPGNLCPLGSLSRGSVKGGGLCPWGSLCREGLCPGEGSMSRRGVSVQVRGSLSRMGGLCPGGSLSTGVSVRGVSVQG